MKSNLKETNEIVIIIFFLIEKKWYYYFLIFSSCNLHELAVKDDISLVRMIIIKCFVLPRSNFYN